MKTATKATAAYKATFTRLTGEGWSINFFGDGTRVFVRPTDNPERRQAPNSHQDAPADFREYEVCYVDADTGRINEQPTTWMAPKHSA